MDRKTVLLHLELDGDNRDIVSLTSRLAHRLEADIIGIAACQPAQILLDEGWLAGDILLEDRKEIHKELQDCEAAFLAALANQERPAEWRSVVTPLSLSEQIALESRAADMVITGPDQGFSPLDSSRRVKIADLVMKAGRPVLIVPKGCQELALDHALVAWKDTREARRALADSLPVLRLANTVTVAGMASGPDVPATRDSLSDVARWLAKHGIAARCEVIPLVGTEGGCLADYARQTAADLVVAGAYGHIRARELLLGGVTQDFLMKPDRCVLISH